LHSPHLGKKSSRAYFEKEVLYVCTENFQKGLLEIVRKETLLRIIKNFSESNQSDQHSGTHCGDPSSFARAKL